MKTLFGLLLGAALVVSGHQAAASERVSDPAYLQAARCAGLIRANGGDATLADAFVQAQSVRRRTDVQRSAVALRNQVQRDMAKGTAREQLSAEYARHCAAYTGGAQAAADASGQSAR